MAKVTVIEVPQWQGSAAPEARRLADGAAMLAELLPASTRLSVPVPDTPGRAAGGVRALDVLSQVATEVRACLDTVDAGLIVTVGGDCGVELVPISNAVARHGADLAVVWFDAHPDLNTPRPSPSGGFHGMVLRTLLGEGPDSLVPATALRPDQIVLAGTRALDPPERDFIARKGIPVVSVPDLADPTALLTAVAATNASTVYVHIDLDVLDPEVFTSVGYPEPNGLHPDRLLAAVTALAAHYPLAGLGITEYQPSRPEDHDRLRAMVAALPIVEVNAAS